MKIGSVFGSRLLILGRRLQRCSVYAQDQDPLLRAMKDELAHSRQLRIENLDPLYFIEYRVEDDQVVRRDRESGSAGVRR